MATEGGEPPYVLSVLRQWDEENGQSSYDPVPVLTTLAEIIESEAEAYMKMDPDPFDERHPSRAYPNCSLGYTLKVLFRKEQFMTKLVNDYLRDNYYARQGIKNRDVRILNIAACRLMLDITPGLETAAVFEMPTNDVLVHRLFSWAEKSPEPLRTYATGLLAAAMEVQDIAVSFREQNLRLVPLMLERLYNLHLESREERSHHSNHIINQHSSSSSSSSMRPFAHLGNTENESLKNNKSPRENNRYWSAPSSSKRIKHDEIDTINKSPGLVNGISKDREESPLTETRRPSTEGMMSPPLRSSSQFNTSDCSNSSWAEMESYVIGNIQMHPPLTLATKQLFILKYLTPMGEYQEFLSHIFEKKALELIISYINLKETRNARLSFEALKYLASLLCHKKFSIEFINVNGLQELLAVPRPSIAATGISICLYYLAYCEDAMERVCLLSPRILSDLVRYSLWLLECSHDSGRCHATMFFGLSFQFRVILQEFDAQDGLRKLFNVISTLPILSIEDHDNAISEDTECSARQIVRHVCVALKRYMEAHLYIKSEQIRRSYFRDSYDNSEVATTLPSYKACKSSPEDVKEQINILLEYMSVAWRPVDELLRLGGITLLLQIIAFSYDWNYSGRSETVRSILDVISICSVVTRVQIALCNAIEIPDDNNMMGINIILGAAEGEIVADPDVQRSALHVIITCVCAPIFRVGGAVARYSSGGSNKKRTQTYLSSQEVIEKVWECLRTTNGIMVLLNLIQTKMPITDADSIRGLACQALAGLARSETVRQIISKLPLFTTGQLQNLMRDPILQDRRQEHVTFQKYALELLERVSGKRKPKNEQEPSLTNIHKANVVAQTRIQFNDRDLLQLIQQHLQSHGYTESSEVLQREAGLPPIKPPQPQMGMFLSPFTYEQRVITPARNRNSLVKPATETPPRPPAGPIKLNIGPSSSSSSASYFSGWVWFFTSLSSSNEVFEMFSERMIEQNVALLDYKQSIILDSPMSLDIDNDEEPETSVDVNNSKIVEIAFNQHNSLPPPKKNELKQSTTPSTGRSLEKKIYYEPTDLSKPKDFNPNITLDSIITEYLTNQHALCKNPMSICPQFTLFDPHKCPDPKARNKIPANFSMRHSRGVRSRRLDQRLIHSKFCCVHIFRYGDDNAFFTCCDFYGQDKYVIIGSHQGEVKLFNLQNGSEVSAFQCHESYVSQVQCSQKNDLLLTSSTWRKPLSACWNLKNLTFQKMFSMDDEDYVEFSKLKGDKIIGTKNLTATIYDVNTGLLVSTLTPTLSNQYTKNKATFNPTDELVLSDGVLWDVNAGKDIHKFDKLNQTLSGVFHPNGLEVICNTEVWDLRTYHLLRTVPALDQSEVTFSPIGYTIYSVTVEQEAEEDCTFENSFKTLDAYDYSSIATIDVKKSIYDLACNRRDTQIALVENQGMFDSIQESVVKIYDVGRSRTNDDEPGEEEEEDDDEDMDASDGSNSEEDPQNDTLEVLDEIMSEDGEQDNSNAEDEDYEIDISDDDIPTYEIFNSDSSASD